MFDGPDIHDVALKVAEAAANATLRGEYRRSDDLWDLHTELVLGIVTRPLSEVLLDIR